MKILPFTRYLDESSTGYSKLKTQQVEKISLQETEKEMLSEGIEIYIPYFKDLTKKLVADYSGDDFEIFYSFKSSVRGSRRYGDERWTARMLYEFLCETYNRGEKFIDTYFNLIFPSRQVYFELARTIKDIEKIIEENWKEGNLKGGQWKKFYKIQDAKQQELKESLKIFDKWVKDDIILCLQCGLLPMNFILAESTRNKRRSLGLPMFSPFYATGWLIRQLQIHVVLGEGSSGNFYYSDTFKGIK
jgi:hypothetical protein